MQGKTIFHEEWWLDASAGKNNWDQIIYEKNGYKIFWPFYKKNFLGLKLLKQPQLTPFLGPWFECPNNTVFKYGKYDELISKAFDMLPKHHLINQCFGRELDNYFILNLKKINYETLHTYILPVMDEKELLGNYSRSLKRDIKYARASNITVTLENNFNVLNNLSNLTFKSKLNKRPYDENYLKNLYTEANLRKRCKLYISRNIKQEPCACALILTDNISSYYLVGGQNRNIEGGQHSMKLVLHNAILDSFSSNKKFDFEGSMNPSIENFFRSFGGKRVPYILVRNINNKYLKLIDFFIKNF